MRRLTLLICVSCFLAPISASAAPVEVVLSGVIDTVTDLLAQLDPAIIPGSSQSGTYVFDSVSPGVSGIFGSGGVRYNPDFSSSVTIDVEGNAFVAEPSGVSIANDNFDGMDTDDQWNTQFSSPVVPGSMYPIVAFKDNTLSRITDATDYFVNTSPAGWTTAQIKIFYFTGSGFEGLAIGTITSIQVVSAFPSLAPLGIATLLGLLGLVGYRRLCA